MKKILWLFLIIALVGAVVTGCSRSTTRGSEASDATPGTGAANAITKVTGVAISPLLGMGLVGAWEWWHTPKEKAADMPWYAHFLFWAPTLLLCAAIACKDVFGAALPPGAKKPIDTAEVVENKVNGLVAAGMFVPIAAAIFHSQSGSAMTDTAPVLGFEWISLLNIFTIPFAVAAFVVVWLCGHVINVLILISPFGAVDAALKSFRTALMGTLAVVGLINPWLGALLSLIVIAFCALMAGWAFRFMVFGSIFSWDFLTFRRHRFEPDTKANWMFTARRIKKTPIRTYGKLSRSENGELQFEYRPWLVMAKRTMTLPEGKYVVGRGLFYPEIMQLVSDEKSKTMLLLPPRYKSHEEEMAKICALTGVQDVGILKGFKALWRWVKSLLGFGSRKETATA